MLKYKKKKEIRLNPLPLNKFTEVHSNFYKKVTVCEAFHLLFGQGKCQKIMLILEKS